MPHNLHEWITVDYLGDAKQVCKRCKQAFTPEKVNDVCEAEPTKIAGFQDLKSAPLASIDPIKFLKTLDAETIRGRIETLTSECEAWKILLTVVEARDRKESV